MSGSLLREARIRAALTQSDLARLSGASRPTLSAYENMRVSPTLDTVDRLVGAAGFRLDIAPRIQWEQVDAGRRRIAWVPNQLFRLPIDQAFRCVFLPLHLEWSRKTREANLAEHNVRARVYEVVLREGRPEDIESIVDGALLLDHWDELVLPKPLTEAWQSLVDTAKESSCLDAN